MEIQKFVNKSFNILISILVIIAIGLYIAMQIEAENRKPYINCVETSDYTDSALHGCEIKFNK